MTTTRPSGPPDSGGETHEDLMQRLGNLLLDLVPDQGWRRIDLFGAMTVAVHHVRLTVIMDDGSRSDVAPPPEVIQVLTRLRVLLYDPEKGAWFSARIAVDPPGSISYSYNYDFEPALTPAMDAASYETDLKTLARPEWNVPDWLRAQLGKPLKRRPAAPTSPLRRPLTMVESGNVMKDFTTWMVHSLPADWEQLFLTFRSVGTYTEVRGDVLTVLGASARWTPPAGAADYLLELKSAMYKMNEEAWTSLRYHLVRPLRFTVDYDWDHEPDWDHVPPAASFAEEIEEYPRDGANLPQWLRQRLRTPSS
jgi:hypothetical protein